MQPYSAYQAHPFLHSKDSPMDQLRWLLLMLSNHNMVLQIQNQQAKIGVEVKRKTVGA